MLLSLLKSLYFQLLTFYNKDRLNKVKIPVNIQEDCLILGNGPSLLIDIDTIKLDPNPKAVVNNFGFNELYEIIKPKFYYIVDPAYWAENITSEYLEDRKLFRILHEKTNWELMIIVPFVAYKKISQEFGNHKFIKVHFYNHTIIPWNYKDNLVAKMYSRFMGSPRLQNVIGASIFISIVLGYKNIKLFGVEHSWLADIVVDEENRVCWKEKHFYEVASVRPHLKSNGENYKLHELLFDYGHMFNSYHIIKKFADISKCQIINCTSNSYIDAFYKLKKND